MDEIVARLAAHAAARPDHPAVVEGDVVVGYAAFHDHACRIAAAIAAHGDHPKVMIHLPQGADAYAAMFASGMAGGVYAPSNVTAPMAKQRMVLEQFDPDVIISTKPLFEALTAGLETPLPAFVDPSAVQSLRPLAEARSPHVLAYVIFTSGSTGVPKGVMVPRAALTHFMGWATAATEVTPSDRWSQHPNLAFDLSVLDIYGALCAGATLFPITGAMQRLMPARAIRDLGLTIWNSVPSVVALMMRAGQVTAENLSSLRLMTFCGEPLLPEQLDALFAVRPDLVIHNTYGPTEATVSCTLARLRASDYRSACRATVALGDAIPGMALHLVNGESPSSGEIAITGPQLACGYWNAAGNDASAFRDLNVDGHVLPAYLTGDWAERSGDQLYFVGRRDSQVKVRGHRLELGEVNAALRRCGYPVAIAVADGSALHAFLESDVPADAKALRLQLSELLEPHAVPAHFHTLNRLPRSSNDKIDVPALLAAVRQEQPL